MIGVLDEKVIIPAEKGVTKVGGIPQWIAGEPKDINKSFCSKCGGKMSLLISADCPVTSGYDRVIYLYICTKCGMEGKVWRQKVLSKEEINEHFFPIPKFEEIEPKKEKTKEDLLSALDDFNNIPLNKNNNKKNKKQISKVQYEKGYFPAYYVSIWDEPEAMIDPKTNIIISGSNDSTGSFANEEDGTEVDPILIEYNERISRVPDQILRYSLGGEPLLQDPLEINVPPCPFCNSPRIFEFEIIPTIIYLLAPNNDEMDFGPILVYTCSNDCNEGCLSEHCIVCPP